jgi:Uma2 family endonuclease
MSSAAAQRVVVDDPTFYPATDDMGDPTLQIAISVLLLALVERWLASRGKPAFVCMNTFFYWKQFVRTECVAPDVYVLPGVSLSRRPPVWKVWETGKVPSFALEVVSSDVDKDYLESPPKYDRLGVKELVVFDPYHAASPDRVRWQVYRRVKNRGLVKVEATNADRVASRSLGCFLRAVGEGDDVRVRLGTGPGGDTLFPTAEEAQERAEADREAERAARERAEADRDADREVRERAEADRERAEADREAERAVRERAEAGREAERAARERAEAAQERAEAGREVERAARERAEAELAQLRAEVARGRRRG